MNTAVKHHEKKNSKFTLKFLLIFLPVLALLIGIGLGLVLATTPFATDFDLYLKVGIILLPVVFMLIIALNFYFKKIDSL